MNIRHLIPTFLIGMTVLLGGCSSRNTADTLLQAKHDLTPPGATSATHYLGPQGIFDEPNSTFDSIVTVLGTGEIYGMDVIDGRVAGFYHGTATGTNAAIASKAVEYNAMDGGYIQDVDFFATYHRPSMQVKLVFPFGTFDGTATGQKPYGKDDRRSIYENAAPLATLAGTYDGELGSVGTSMALYTKVQGLVLSRDGKFAADAGNCHFTGALRRHGHTGAYDVAAQAGGTGCAIAGPMRGVLTPVTIGANGTTLGFQMLAPGAKTSATLYVVKRA